MPDDDDDRILEFLGERGIIATAKVIAIETGINHNTVRSKLRKLHDRGLVRHPHDVPNGMSKQGVYQLTDLGERYVEGDITIAEFRERLNDT